MEEIRVVLVESFPNPSSGRAALFLPAPHADVSVPGLLAHPQPTKEVVQEPALPIVQPSEGPLCWGDHSLHYPQGFSPTLLNESWNSTQRFILLRNLLAAVNSVFPRIIPWVSFRHEELGPQSQDGQLFQQMFIGTSSLPSAVLGLEAFPEACM